MHTYIGAYTAPPTGTGAGISLVDLNPISGALTPIDTFSSPANPAYLARSRDGLTIYAACETDPGVAAAFRRDPQTGNLTLINTQEAHGSPCHLSLDSTGEFLFLANYFGGTVTVLPIASDGSLEPASCVINHTGSSINTKRQSEPHPHMIDQAGDQSLVLASDLGADQIVEYDFDDSTGVLTAAGAIKSPAGAGPRHFCWSANGRWLYVLNELDSTLSVFARDDAGLFDQVQVLPTLPECFDGESTCAHIARSLDGRFLYASNRGHDSIAAFEVDTASGEVTTQGHTGTQGDTPRNFGIDPTGKWLIVANQDSHNLVVFERHAGTGALTSHGESLTTGSPVCVLFVD